MESSMLLLVIAGGFFLISLIMLGYALVLMRKASVKKKRNLHEDLFLQATLRNTVDSIYLKDTQSRILLANDIFIKHMQRPPEKVYGYTDIDFFGEEFGAMTIAEEKAIIESGEPMVSAIEERVIETGDRNYVLTTKVPVFVDGKVTGIFGITREFSAIAKQQEELAYTATHDSLTGLCNRAAITYELHDIIQSKSPVAVLFIDLDNFKRFNDEYGHDFGDELLKMIAQRMRSSLRKDDLVGRLSGDEFVVVLRGIRTKEEAEIATRKLLESFKLPFGTLGKAVICSFSIGIACTVACPIPEDVTVEDLIRRADHAMYEVKKAGKGGYKFFESNHKEDLDLTY